MYCNYCGNEIADGSRFCPVCGAPLQSVQPVNAANIQPAAAMPYPGNNMNMGQNTAGNMQQNMNGAFVTKNIVLCNDGKYRWMYSMSLLKNPTVLFSIWKAFGLTAGIMFVLFFFIDLFSGNLDAFFGGAFKVLFIGLLIVFVLSLLGYGIYAAILGGEYQVIFEMGEDKIYHIHAPKQFRKAQKSAIILGLIGVMSGNLTLMGESLYVGTNNAVSSTYRDVKKVRSVRKRNVIYVSELFMKNQIYVEDEDFDFVENFIKSRCVNAKLL